LLDSSRNYKNVNRGLFYASYHYRYSNIGLIIVRTQQNIFIEFEAKYFLVIEYDECRLMARPKALLIPGRYKQTAIAIVWRGELRENFDIGFLLLMT